MMSDTESEFRVELNTIISMLENADLNDEGVGRTINMIAYYEYREKTKSIVNNIYSDALVRRVFSD